MSTRTEHDLLDPTNWIGAKELAAILGYSSVQGIYNLTSEGGDLPPLHKKGRHIRFFRPEVEAWLKTGRRLPAHAQIQQRAEAQSH